jgi:hypothetical protein
MQHAHCYISTLILAAALATPAMITAAEPQASVQVRVYDRDHKDYHNWDDNENRAYLQYHSENRNGPAEFSKASRKQQSDYWKWRHAHPDNH